MEAGDLLQEVRLFRVASRSDVLWPNTGPNRFTKLRTESRPGARTANDHHNYHYQPRVVMHSESVKILVHLPQIWGGKGIIPVRINDTPTTKRIPNQV